MATLPTLRPTSFVSSINTSTTAVENVNDGSDATYNESIAGSDITGEWVYEVTDMPSDFESMDGSQITVTIRCAVPVTGDDSWSVRPLLRDSAGTQVSDTPAYSSLNVGTTAVQEFQTTLTKSGNNDKTAWDAVRLVIDFSSTRNMADDSNSLRIMDAWADGTYTPSSPPATAPTLTIGAVSGTTADMSCTAVQDATTYEFQRDSVTQQNTSSRTFSDSGLTAGTSYAYRVRAVNGAGAGPWSEVKTVTTIPTARFGLTDPNTVDPADPRTISVRAGVSAGTGSVTFSLYELGTLVEEWTESLSTTITTFSHSVSNAVTNYDDLELRLTGTVDHGSYLQVYWAELEVPVAIEINASATSLSTITEVVESTGIVDSSALSDVAVSGKITTSIGASYDGYVTKGRALYADLTGDTDGDDVYDSRSFIYAGQRKEEEGALAGVYTFRGYQSFLEFDTSVLPDDAVIDEVTFSVYWDGDYSTIDTTMSLRAFDFGPTVDVSDWRSSAEAGGLVEVASRVMSDGIDSYVTFTSTAEFVNQISALDVTRLALFSQRYIDAVEPGDGERQYEEFHSDNFNNPAYITVTYHVVDTLVVGYLTASGAANVDPISAAIVVPGQVVSDSTSGITVTADVSGSAVNASISTASISDASITEDITVAGGVLAGGSAGVAVSGSTATQGSISIGGATGTTVGASATALGAISSDAQSGATMGASVGCFGSIDSGIESNALVSAAVDVAAMVDSDATSSTTIIADVDVHSSVSAGAVGSATVDSIALSTATVSTETISDSIITSSVTAIAGLTADVVAGAVISAGSTSTGAIAADSISDLLVDSIAVASSGVTAGAVSSASVSARATSFGSIDVATNTGVEPIDTRGTSGATVASDSVSGAAIDSIALVTGDVAIATVFGAVVEPSVNVSGHVNSGASASTGVIESVTVEAMVAPGASASLMATGGVDSYAIIDSNAVTQTTVSDSTSAVAAVDSGATTTVSVDGSALASASLSSESITSVGIDGHAAAIADAIVSSAFSTAVDAGIRVFGAVGTSTETNTLVSADGFSASSIGSDATTTATIVADIFTVAGIDSLAAFNIAINSGVESLAGVVSGAITESSITAESITLAAINSDSAFNVVVVSDGASIGSIEANASFGFVLIANVDSFASAESNSIFDTLISSSGITSGIATIDSIFGSTIDGDRVLPGEIVSSSLSGLSIDGVGIALASLSASADSSIFASGVGESKGLVLSDATFNQVASSIALSSGTVDSSAASDALMSGLRTVIGTASFDSVSGVTPIADVSSFGAIASKANVNIDIRFLGLVSGLIVCDARTWGFVGKKPSTVIYSGGGRLGRPTVDTSGGLAEPVVSSSNGSKGGTLIASSGGSDNIISTAKGRN